MLMITVSTLRRTTAISEHDIFKRCLELPSPVFFELLTIQILACQNYSIRTCCWRRFVRFGGCPEPILLTSAMPILMWPLGIGTCIYPPYHQYQCSVYNYIYTCDIGSSVGQYFGIDTGQVEYISENTCLADISISKITLFVSLCEFWVLVSANIGRYYTKISLPVIPVITVFLADTCNLKIQDINITNIFKVDPA